MNACCGSLLLWLTECLDHRRKLRPTMTYQTHRLSVHRGGLILAQQNQFVRPETVVFIHQTATIGMFGFSNLKPCSQSAVNSFIGFRIMLHVGAWTQPTGINHIQIDIVYWPTSCHYRPNSLFGELNDCSCPIIMYYSSVVMGYLEVPVIAMMCAIRWLAGLRKFPLLKPESACVPIAAVVWCSGHRDLTQHGATDS